LHRLTVADVDGEGIYLSVVPLDQLGLQFTEAVDAPGAKDEIRPGGGEPFRTCLADAGAGPGYQYPLPCMRFSIFSVHQAF